MSALVKFVVRCGSVWTNQMWADLSEFQVLELELTASKTWTVSQLKDWLALSFGLDPETYTIDVIDVHI
jgi:hypothetical protein